mgnify:CR=1 FL=1
MKERILKIFVLSLSVLLFALAIVYLFHGKQSLEQEQFDSTTQEENVDKLSLEEAQLLIEEKYSTYSIDSYHEEEDFFEFILRNQESNKVELNCQVNRYTEDIFENSIFNSSSSGGGGVE